MEPWQAIVVALLGGGLLTALAAWLALPGTIYRDLRAQLEFERESRQRCDVALRELQAENRAITAQADEMRTRAGRLQRAADRITDSTIGDVLDRLSCGFVLSSSEDGGKWVWVNRALANSLGYSRDECIEIGWRKLIDPADLRSTQVVEGAAWRQDIDGWVNNYRRRDGKLVQLRWFATRYDEDGISVCVVRDEGVAEG